MNLNNYLLISSQKQEDIEENVNEEWMNSFEENECSKIEVNWSENQRIEFQSQQSVS